MPITLESLENGQDGSSDIHEGQTTPRPKFQDHQMTLKQKLEDKHTPTRTSPTWPFSDGGICAKCAGLEGAFRKALRIRGMSAKPELIYGVPIADVGYQY